MATKPAPPSYVHTVFSPCLHHSSVRPPGPPDVPHMCGTEIVTVTAQCADGSEDGSVTFDLPAGTGINLRVPA